MRVAHGAAAAILALLSACAVFVSAQPSASTPLYRVRVVHVYPHDRRAFTQGLEYHDGYLYEGTGLWGHSTLRQEILETGAVVRQVQLPPRYFGEGITVFGGRIDQLTWKSETGFEYSARSFLLLGTFAYSGEGWGLANDGVKIYMSDGSAQIRVLDPRSLGEVRRFTVHDGARPVTFLNELECVRGEIYANVWQTNRIARISPADGRVLGWIDASGLLTPADEAEPVDVLNGIAYDAARNRLFLTGKLWPKLFQVELVPAGATR
jgi:glutamine cyclotransferase